MSINREAAQKAIDDAFADGVKHLYLVMVEGMIDPLPNGAETMGRFKRGLANHCDAHARAASIIDIHFGLKS